jgi:D-arabinose 1-dehydrogenase-like Zn-dependent alcohol dehydrogenase
MNHNFYLIVPAIFANIGLTAVQYAKAMGFKIIGIDISNSQLEAVKALGADHVLNTIEEPGWELNIKKITGGGCSAAAVFSASNAAYETALKTLRYACCANLDKTQERSSSELTKQRPGLMAC